MFTYSSSKAFGCLANESQSVCPLSISFMTFFVMSRNSCFLELPRKDIQALHERQTGVDHRGELAREDREILRADAARERGS